jgi:hypothetical protein
MSFLENCTPDVKIFLSTPLALIASYAFTAVALKEAEASILALFFLS